MDESSRLKSIYRSARSMQAIYRFDQIEMIDGSKIDRSTGEREKSIKKNRSDRKIIRIWRESEGRANQDIVRYAKVEGRSYGIHRVRELVRIENSPARSRDQ